MWNVKITETELESKKETRALFLERNKNFANESIWKLLNLENEWERKTLESETLWIRNRLKSLSRESEMENDDRESRIVREINVNLLKENPRRKRDSFLKERNVTIPEGKWKNWNYVFGKNRIEEDAKFAKKE